MLVDHDINDWIGLSDLLAAESVLVLMNCLPCKCRGRVHDAPDQCRCPTMLLPGSDAKISSSDCVLVVPCRKSYLAAQARQAAAAHGPAQPAAPAEGRAGRLQVRQLARSDVTHDLATWQKLQVGPIFTAILQLTHCIRLTQSELHILEWRHQLARLHAQFYLKSLSHA